MDADGLPIVGPGIDYSKVGAIHQKRTLAFLNHFVTHTAGFLNRFSCVCEEKLENLTVRLQRLETTMNILEAKLSSIPGLENVTVPSSSTTSTSTTTTAPPGGETQTAKPPAASQPEPSAQQPEVVDAAPEPVKEKPTMTVAQDPRYAKFFKMLQVGVPAMALHPKMLAEGLDPNLLENPNAPAPGGSGSGKNENIDSELSEDEDEDEENSSASDESSSGFSD